MAAKKKQEEVLPPSRNPSRDALEAFTAKHKGFRPAREILRKVTAVPSCFPSYDWATGVGGHPLDRVALVHGPSSHGKTTLCHGLGLSFLQRGHFYKFVDAEMTSSITWLETLMGEHADNPQFVASRPTSYEETVDEVRSFCQGIVTMRKEGVVSDETSGIVVVDSIKKLVPQRLMEKILKEGAEGEKGSIDGMSGRAAMYKAALNAAWMDELIPLMHETRTTIVLIARESENTEKSGLYDADWKLSGGKAIFYDSSLVMRVTRAGWIKSGSGEDASVIGERHKVNIYKSKVAGKDDKSVSAFFNTSNGAIVPEGFDRARDVIELAEKFGVVKKTGAWLNWDEHKWNGTNKAVVDLTNNQALLAELETTVRGCFLSNQIEEENENQ